MTAGSIEFRGFGTAPTVMVTPASTETGTARAATVRAERAEKYRWRRFGEDRWTYTDEPPVFELNPGEGALVAARYNQRFGTDETAVAWVPMQHPRSGDHQAAVDGVLQAQIELTDRVAELVDVIDVELDERKQSG